MWKWVRRLLFAGAALVLVSSLALVLLLLGSLPKKSGEAELPGLSAAVRVERDSLSVPAIRAESLEDAFRAIGFLHAQERFFQMDLLRKTSAGELASLLPGTLEYDKRFRAFRFRALAERAVAVMDPANRALLNAYTAGVNAGLRQLRVRPFEYLMLRSRPTPWEPEDTFLVAYAMYLDLEGGHARLERSVALMHQELPDTVYRFFCRNGNFWEAALDDSTTPILPVPPKSNWSFLLDRTESPAETPLIGRLSVPGAVSGSLPSRAEDILANGSNAWAIAGDRTESGHSLLAGDPHLGLRVPHLWYRIDATFPGRSGRPEQLTGVTIPGIPLIVIGSNTRVAWSMTVAYADTEDIVRLIPDPDRSGHYLVPGGSEPVKTVRETIRNRHGVDAVIEVQMTRFGPIVGKDSAGLSYALLWSGLQVDSFNFNWARIGEIRTVAELADLANRMNMPAQNLVMADAEGNIGWTIGGWLPSRQGYSGYLPVNSNDRGWAWNGRLTPDRYPRIINPDNGVIWSANQRHVSGEAAALIGDGFPTWEARAWVIRETLRRLDSAGVDAMTNLQRDITAVQLNRWHKLLATTATEMDWPAGGAEQSLAHTLRNWTGRAEADSTAYRLVREFRLQMRDRVLTRLLGHLQEKDPGFRITHVPYEEPLWLIVSQQPEYLTDPRLGSWKAEFEFVIRDIFERALQATGNNPSQYTWGDVNRLRMTHPLGAAIPFLGRWLNMPDTPMDGDRFTVNAQSREHGPSFRFVVAPGNEVSAVFSMPGGQSGHPLSHHYRDHHALWLQARQAPFRAGEPLHTLILVPESITAP